MKKAFTFALGLIRESFSRFRNPMVISFSVINYVVSMRFPAGCGEPICFIWPDLQKKPPLLSQATAEGLKSFCFKSGYVAYNPLNFTLQISIYGSLYQSAVSVNKYSLSVNYEVF